MSETTNKYSLWLVPTGDAEVKLGSLVQTLVSKYDAPAFVPHITLVGNIYADELDTVTQKVELLAEQLGRFKIAFNRYEYLDEEFRCLFLPALSEDIHKVYESAANLFPQVAEEHFKAMPHLSVLYGNFPKETKQEIINEHPIETIEFAVDSLELYLTNDPISSWEHKASVPIKAS